MAPQFVTNWHAFENAVAALYRAMGVPLVRQNIDLAGNQIDVYLEERTSASGLVRTAVECKYYSKPVPKDAVVQFSMIGGFLRHAGLVDKAIMVGYQGFTQSASIAAQAGHVELVSFVDLEARLPPPGGGRKYSGTSEPQLSQIIAEAEDKPVPSEFPDTVFVVMPFSRELEDVYLYGIRKCVHEFGYSCRRADEIEHSSSIVDEILDQIRRCRVIVAEVSDRNPNVFYEVGWAHALGRETVLIARNGVELPFDVSHINTIMYDSIHQLEDRLRARLALILGGAA